MKILQSLTVLSAALLAVAACDEPATAPTSTTPEADPLIEQLVIMGAKRDQIVDRGDHFVVEGDIRLDKTDLRAARRAAEPDGRAHPVGPRHQRYVSTIAANRKTIHVDLSAVAAENTAWANATRAAMSNWNSVVNSYISFVEGGPADIVVSFVNTLNTQGECVAAQGAWPSSGAPGATVQISRLYAGAYTNAEQVWIMTHELGHNIGLAHTNQTFGTQLSATPTSDGSSVMNSGSAFGGGCPPAAPAWSWFSSYDQVAMQALYPIPAASGLSVSHPSGVTVVSWDPSGALYYQVQRVEERAVNDWISNDFSTTVTEEGWSAPIYGTSFTTGSTWTGASSCMWAYTWAYDDTSTYSYQVMAVFANGTNSNFSAILSEDAPC
jgi:Dual-action HEIGH metallo-peptidase